MKNLIKKIIGIVQVEKELISISKEIEELKINIKVNSDWSIEPENSSGWRLLKYKNNDVISFYYNQEGIRIRKCEKPEIMKNERLYMSDVYLMIFDKLCENMQRLTSDENISIQAKRMWSRISTKVQSERADLNVQIIQIPYSIERR